MSNLIRRLAPWWNEKDANDKERRVEKLSMDADEAVSRSKRILQSYREASAILTTTMRK